MKTQFVRKQFVRDFPSNMREADGAHFRKILNYDCPSLNIHQFKSIKVLPDGTLFKGISPLSLSFPFFRGRLKHHNKKGILFIRVKWRAVKLSANVPYVIIHDPWTQNYYHWITQALPRLLLVQQLNEPFILLLPDDHQSEFHIESLKLLQLESWQTIERKNKYYDVHNLWYPTHDIQIGDYNDNLIKMLHCKLSRIAANVEQRKKLFIRRARRETRRIINEEEVLQVFLSFDFEIVEFERLSFVEQILLAGKARVLAGVHGAGLTNMIFMPISSVVFELTTKVNGDNYYYYSLSNALSHKYYYQVCDTDNEAIVQEANLLVDINELKANITLMLKDDPN